MALGQMEIMAMAAEQVAGSKTIRVTRSMVEISIGKKVAKF
jgi:hypothetical protein